jgi:hypothetical protein
MKTSTFIRYSKYLYVCGVNYIILLYTICTYSHIRNMFSRKKRLSSLPMRTSMYIVHCMLQLKIFTCFQIL